MVAKKRSIAVGEPNPATPTSTTPSTTPKGTILAHRTARLKAKGYTGPMPGSPELAAARKAGEHPIMDWRKSVHAAKKATRVAAHTAKVATRAAGDAVKPASASAARSIVRPNVTPPKPAGPRPLPVKPVRPNLSRPKR